MKKHITSYRIERATTLQVLVETVNNLLQEEAGWEPHEQVFPAQLKMTEGSQLTYFYCQTMVKVSYSEK
jgi:alanine-alpha-ketoisovalerate/valine-pyruvate aminotransferase